MFTPILILPSAVVCQYSIIAYAVNGTYDSGERRLPDRAIKAGDKFQLERQVHISPATVEILLSICDHDLARAHRFLQAGDQPAVAR